MAKKNGVIKKDFKEANLKYPKLELIWTETDFYCKGEVDIFDSKNIYWDSFKIKISVPIKCYPYYFPLLFLEDDRIPNEEDRHINPDMSCCVEVEQKQFLRAKRGISILNFLDEYVVPHFADQLFFEKEKKWANGDYEHGFDGKLQYYLELTGVSEKEKLLYVLKNLEKIKSIKMYDSCFCGSDKKLKFCHRDQLNTLLKLPKSLLNKDISTIEELSF